MISGDLELINKYTHAGWPTIRLVAYKKYPKDKNGVYSARIECNETRFRNLNVGLPCGPIIVLDVDPRNDGLLTLGNIVRGYGELPETLKCLTPSGGYHLYFWNRDKLPSFKLPGLDFQSYGRYVVLPPSRLKIQGDIVVEYQWDGDFDLDKIAPAPDWFADLHPKWDRETCTREAEYAQLEPEELKAFLWRINADCDYNDWIAIGMALHHWSEGEPFGLNIFIEWSDTSPKHQGSEREFKDHWNSFDSRVNNPITASHIIWRANQAPLNFRINTPNLAKQVAKVLSPPEEERPLEKDFYGIEQIIALLPENSLLSALFQYFMTNARWQYPEFAISAATTLLSTLWQRRFISPTRSSLSVYSIICAESGMGKDAYRQLLQEFFLKLWPNSLMGTPGSAEGIGQFLSTKSASAIYIQDEVQTLIKSMYAVSHSSNRFEAIEAKFMQLSNDVSLMQGNEVIGKENKVTSVTYPKLSIFGLTTLHSYKKLLNIDDFVENGLLSRIDFWPASKNEFQSNFAKVKLPDSQRDRLLKEFTLSKLASSGDNAPIPLSFSDKSCSDMVDAYAKAVHNKRIQNPDDRYIINLMARVPIKVLRFASLAALSSGAMSISPRDVEFAIQLTKVLVCLNEALFVDDQVFLKIERRIVQIITKEKGAHESEFSRRISEFRRLPPHLQKSVLDNLIYRKVIKVVGKLYLLP